MVVVGVVVVEHCEQGDRGEKVLERRVNLRYDVDPEISP